MCPYIFGGRTRVGESGEGDRIGKHFVEVFKTFFSFSPYRFCINAPVVHEAGFAGDRGRAQAAERQRQMEGRRRLEQGRSRAKVRLPRTHHHAKSRQGRDLSGNKTASRRRYQHRHGHRYAISLLLCDPEGFQHTRFSY